jgi:uridine kinase
MIFIFIGGASASGKTGLSEHILTKLGKEKAQILSMDDYYKEITKEAMEKIGIKKYRLNTNFDTPDMLDLALFQKHVLELFSGKSIMKQLFDFETNLYKEEQEEIIPSEVIIVEGIFAQYFYKHFWPPKLPALTVNIATDSYRDIVNRRLKRDIDRGRSEEQSLSLEKKYVGPGFLKYTANSASGSDIYINNKHKETKEDQDSVLKEAAAEIIAELKVLQEKIALDSFEAKRPSPNIQDRVIKSYGTVPPFFDKVSDDSKKATKKHLEKDLAEGKNILSFVK